MKPTTDVEGSVKRKMIAQLHADSAAFIKKYEDVPTPKGQSFATPPTKIMDDFIHSVLYFVNKTKSIFEEENYVCIDPEGLDTYLMELAHAAAFCRAISNQIGMPIRSYYMAVAWLSEGKKDILQSIQTEDAHGLNAVELGEIADPKVRGKLVARDFAAFALMSLQREQIGHEGVINQLIEGAAIFNGHPSEGHSG